MNDLEFEVNILEFEVHNQILKRLDSQDVVNKNKNVYKCRFNFEEDSEWIDLNKFAIFTDGWGNSTTQHLGNDGNILTCLVPDKVLRGSYFKISVYGGDLITTNNITIMLMESGYKPPRPSIPHHPPFPPHCDPTKPRLYHPHHHHHRWWWCNDKEDIWVEIFKTLDGKIDSIIYDNHTLQLFSKEHLIESVYLPFIEEEDLPELVDELVERFIEEVPTASSETAGLMSIEDKLKLDSIENGANRTIVDDSLDFESNNPISNRVVSNALNGKEDVYDFVERMDDLIQELIDRG